MQTTDNIFINIFEAISTDYHIDNTANYADRISQAQKSEGYIWQKILIAKGFPWTIRKSSTQEDRRGIDAFMSLKGSSSEKTIQLKYRQTGDDIVLDTVRPWHGLDSMSPPHVNLTGRDMKTPVDIYFAVDPNLKLRIITGSYMRDVVKRMVDKFVMEYARNPTMRSSRSEYGTARVVVDQSAESYHGHGKLEKLLVFVDPAKLKVNYTVQL